MKIKLSACLLLLPVLALAATTSAPSSPACAENSPWQKYQDDHKPDFCTISTSIRAYRTDANLYKSELALGFKTEADSKRWLVAMSARLAQKIPDKKSREDLLHLIHYEAVRAGLDQQLVLSVIDVLSHFDGHAISSFGAEGLMYVHKGWISKVGKVGDNLIDLGTNLRYGCVILRYYIEIENGDLSRALARYRGQTLGSIELRDLAERSLSDFAAQVRTKLHGTWRYEEPTQVQRPTTQEAALMSRASAPRQTLAVPLQVAHGTFFVPVTINGAINLFFVLDSGAADVQIPADVVSTLFRTGTLDGADFLGQRTYVLADGSTIPSATFRIRSMVIGNRIVQNVVASVGPAKGELLLGQSVLNRFKSWTIDNSRPALILE